MPGGIEITTNKTAKPHYFPVPHVSLPILKKNGALEALPWGRRNEEDGLLPPGGWARLSSIKQGTWERYHAVPVKIPATGWMEKDDKGIAHYFPLSDDECLQGLVARKGIEKRVYIVTVAASDTAAVHSRAPRIINRQKPPSLCRVNADSESAPFAKEMTQSSSTPPQPDNVEPTPPTIRPPLPAWSSHLPLRQRVFLHVLTTLGEVSGEAIRTEHWLRQLRADETHGKS